MKLALKATIARELIPLKYRAKVGDKLTSLKVKAHRVNTDIRNTQSKTLKDTHGSETKTPFENNNIQELNEGKSALKSGANAKASSQKSRGVFNFNAETNPKVKSDPNPPYKQKIKNFDPIKTHQAQKENQATKPPKNERSSWITPASVKSKPMMDDIARKMAKERRAQPPPQQEKQHDRNTMKGQFNASVSEKFTTNEAHREKTRAEAETTRSHVPPEYRAKPYPPEPNKEPEKKPQGHGFKSKVQSTFNDARDAVKSKWEGFKAGQQQPTPEGERYKHRPKMSAGFNKASSEGKDQSEMNDSPKAQDWKPKNE